MDNCAFGGLSVGIGQSHRRPDLNLVRASDLEAQCRYVDEVGDDRLFRTGRRLPSQTRLVMDREAILRTPVLFLGFTSQPARKFGPRAAEETAVRSHALHDGSGIGTSAIGETP